MRHVLLFFSKEVNEAVRSFFIRAAGCFSRYTSFPTRSASRAFHELMFLVLLFPGVFDAVADKKSSKESLVDGGQTTDAGSFTALFTVYQSALSFIVLFLANQVILVRSSK
jgi:hypothetical protein